MPPNLITHVVVLTLVRCDGQRGLMHNSSMSYQCNEILYTVCYISFEADKPHKLMIVFEVSVLNRN